MVEMSVSGVILEPKSHSPIVLLKDAEERRALLIWVGENEANAIALALEEVETPRPMTHDLLKSVLTTLLASLREVRITEVRDGTFFAELDLEHEGQQYAVDSRPSDAIALALRCGAPIRVAETVMASAAVPIRREAEEDEAEAFRRFVDEVKPSDFGKFGGSPS